MKKTKESLKKVWDFLQGDGWPSFVVVLILAFIIIKFIFFPGLSLLTGTSLPIVIVESCSMYHQHAGLGEIFKSPVYNNFGITLNDTKNWDFKNGLTKGDVIFVVAPKHLKIGDIIIFNGGVSHPIIHRLIKVGDTYETKGDNYRTNSRQLPSERNIKKNQIIGKALFKVPLVGWLKLIFFEGSRIPEERGLC